MAEVNYIASTSKAEEPLEASVKIIEPKVKKNSISSEGKNALKKLDKSIDSEYLNRPSGELFFTNNYKFKFHFTEQ